MLMDVLIIGGSFAGLSAAMPLIRARRNVLVLDTKMPRNRYARASHGVFCLDGNAPDDIQAKALAQLKQYPTFSYKEDEAKIIDVTDAGFAVATSAGAVYRAKKVILAFGIQDQLPDIPGVRKFWGRSVIHCPYCHAYELSSGPLGVLATQDISLHQASMVSEWGATTLFTQGKFRPQGEHAETLQRQGVRIEDTPVVAVDGEGDQISAVRLKDGRHVALQGLFVAPTLEVKSPLIDSLALRLKDTPTGTFVEVDEFKESSVKGVFVAGDLSNPMQNATFAIASGTMAGIAAHRALIFNL